MRARSALLLAVLLGMASPAAAVSLFGEVIAEDPMAIRPGEEFTIEIGIDGSGELVSLFEGRFEVGGAEILNISLPFGLADLCCFVTQIDQRILLSTTFSNTPVPVDLMDVNLQAKVAGPVSIDVLGDVADAFAQRDTLTGVEDVLRITERVPLELRSQGVSLGTSLTIVPEPATVGLLAVGLAGLVVGRARRRVCHRRPEEPT